MWSGLLDQAQLRITEMGVHPGSWISQKDVLTLSLTIFDRTFLITEALNSLTLLVSALALFTALLALHKSRIPEYCFWRAIGLNSPKFLLVVGCPVLFMSVIVMILSLPLGLALSWLLINKINVVAFGWTMPLLVDGLAIFRLMALVFIAVLLSFALALLGLRSNLDRSMRKLAAV